MFGLRKRLLRDKNKNGCEKIHIKHKKRLCVSAKPFFVSDYFEPMIGYFE